MQMPCKYCGSRKHGSDDCHIYQKVELAKIGVPLEHLFDIIEADSLEDAAEQVARRFTDADPD